MLKLSAARTKIGGLFRSTLEALLKCCCGCPCCPGIPGPLYRLFGTIVSPNCPDLDGFTIPFYCSDSGLGSSDGCFRGAVYTGVAYIPAPPPYENPFNPPPRSLLDLPCTDPYHYEDSIPRGLYLVSAITCPSNCTNAKARAVFVAFRFYGRMICRCFYKDTLATLTTICNDPLLWEADFPAGDVPCDISNLIPDDQWPALLSAVINGSFEAATRRCCFCPERPPPELPQIIPPPPQTPGCFDPDRCIADPFSIILTA
jgi:hypothetical protein